ncbi:electron transport complex subunit RsxG [Congregibacter sp.]|uniref:electron transport complex subunit RsxG n=1 Tax=Congregibacter sp. TaxID=2744308 RepID=UPI00385E9E62
MNELRQAITRNSLLLAGFAVLTALLVASTFLGTKDRISAAQRAAEEKALLQIIPRASHDNAMLDDRLLAPTNDPFLQLREDKSIYVARRSGVPSAVLIPATAPDGYSGEIELIVGVNRDGSVAGVRVLQHRETPGLGDAVDHRKSNWIDSFKGRSLGNPGLEGWTVRKDGGEFDQFTGATITPRAVVQATARVLQYARNNRSTLFGKELGTVSSEQESTP